MPGYDKKGPEGEGALTGRGQGYCTKTIKKREEPKEPVYCRGRDEQPRGCGRGYGRMKRFQFQDLEGIDPKKLKKLDQIKE